MRRSDDGLETAESRGLTRLSATNAARSAFSLTGGVGFWRATLRSGDDRGSGGKLSKMLMHGEPPRQGPSHVPISRPHGTCPTRAGYKRKDPALGWQGPQEEPTGFQQHPLPPNPLPHGAGSPTENENNRDQTFR